MKNSHITQLIIITVKDVVYHKRKEKGNRITLGDAIRDVSIKLKCM